LLLRSAEGKPPSTSFVTPPLLSPARRGCEGDRGEGPLGRFLTPVEDGRVTGPGQPWPWDVWWTRGAVGGSARQA